MSTWGMEGIHHYDEDSFTKEELKHYRMIDLEPGDKIFWRGSWVLVEEARPLQVSDLGQ